MSESQFSCILEEPMKRGKYAYTGVWVKYALGKSSCVSKIPPVVPKKQRITVSVFISTLQLTALLLKSFRLRLHCYTLSHVTHEGVMSHIWMSHTTWHIWTSRVMRRELLSLVPWAAWMPATVSHVTHMNESCHTHEWVMSHIWMSHVSGVNESCHIDEWDMSHIWRGHVTHVNESCHT